MNTGETTKPAAASVPFSAADYLQADDIPGYLAEVIHDGDTRALPLALRTAADVLGMAELARRTGLNRETLYRTLSENGNPRLDTLGAILDAFGLTLAVQPKEGAPLPARIRGGAAKPARVAKHKPARPAKPGKAAAKKSAKQAMKAKRAAAGKRGFAMKRPASKQRAIKRRARA